MFTSHEAPAPGPLRETVSYSDFLEEIKVGSILHAIVADTEGTGGEILAITRSGTEQHVLVPEHSADTINFLAAQNIPVSLIPAGAASGSGSGSGPAAALSRGLENLLIFAAQLGVMYTVGALVYKMVTGGKGAAASLFTSQIGGDGDAGGGGGGDSDGESDTGVTFAQVAGAENAKQDLAEIVDFLNRPEKYARVGAKVPRGVLLSGPPGCGKTLLARAVAGEAGVPFFHCSGAEFVSLFAGQGAARVRELFAKAKEAGPAIVFIDEIDAVGRSRSGNGPTSGANDERDQTVNQLLTAMDGFENDTGIIVIAATNRPDVLDEALTRPGRFDRRVTVELPDFRGRTDILGVHTRSKPVAADVSLAAYARMTIGFSGADLENLANEAAIYAARDDAEQITRVHFDHAFEKVILGEARHTLVLTDKKKHIIAVHEAGHALMSIIVSDYDLVRKVSILPRGRTGGATYFEPTEDRVDISLVTRTYLENKILVALGGRIAEELVFGTMNVTTGSAGDLQEVYQIAYQMVADFGFNEKLGKVSWAAAPSNDPDSEIGAEIRFIVKRLYDNGKQLLNGQIFYLHRIAEELVQKETLITEDILRLTTGMVCIYRAGYASYDEPDLPMNEA